MRKWILRGLAVVAVLGVAAGLTGFSYLTRNMNYGPPADRSAWLDQTPSVNAGNLAYIQRDVDGAREIWRAVAENEENRIADRASAYRYLSRISWRIYQNTDEAIGFAQLATDLDPEDPVNAIVMADALLAQGEGGRAMAAVRPFVGQALSAEDRIAVAQALARAALSLTEGKRLDEITPDDRLALGEALSALAPIVADAPAPLDVSRLALAAAIRYQDGASVWQAWASYYHSPTGVSAMADVHGAAAILSTALPRWTPRSLSESDRRAIASGLAQSFFFEEAALLLTDQRANADLATEPDFSAIIAMANFTSDLQDHVNEYYRSIAAANSNSNLFATLETYQYRRGRKALAQELWDALGLEGPLDQAALGRTVGQQFGLYWGEAPTSGVYDLHAGFRVLDTTYTADQYGRQADVRYVVVGHMISNGYESWLWDGRQQHGGWATADTIYQVRPAYADDSLRQWNDLTDPAQRAEEEQTIAERTASDPEVLGDARVAYVPGLEDRLYWQGLNAMYDQIVSEVGEENARQAFILAFDDAVREYSIFLHEGRHSLDQVYSSQAVQQDSSELEFRAKISQVIFSDWPRLTLGSIINPNMGDGTPHGTANQRLMEGVVDWMEAHASEIEGLDADTPLLLQFDLLTDEQIRESFRHQDPWAQEAS